jgi:hypothetical protein
LAHRATACTNTARGVRSSRQEARLNGWAYEFASSILKDGEPFFLSLGVRFLFCTKERGGKLQEKSGERREHESQEE